MEIQYNNEYHIWLEDEFQFDPKMATKGSNRNYISEERNFKEAQVYTVKDMCKLVNNGIIKRKIRKT